MEAELETKTVFYEDPYRRELEVWVDNLVQDERFGPCLVLSATLCHPHGGGQKGDRASLLLFDEDARALGTPAELPIVDTRRVDGRILHVLGAPLEPDRAEPVLVGTRPFTLRLDWPFRYRQMRLHDAAHLLHCFVERVLGRSVTFPETSDLQEDYGLNRYEQKDLLTPAQMDEAVRQLNAFTAEGYTVTTYPDQEKPGFRYWRCEGWVIPCGGTHLASTSEIGPLEASLSTRRGRTSITFRLAGG
jgi:Ser-tRNA(Ala) deacylase AlaX